MSSSISISDILPLNFFPTCFPERKKLRVLWIRFLVVHFSQGMIFLKFLLHVYSLQAQLVYGGKRTTCRDCLSLSMTWVWETGLRSSAMRASSFTHWAILLSLFIYLRKLLLVYRKLSEFHVSFTCCKIAQEKVFIRMNYFPVDSVNCFESGKVGNFLFLFVPFYFFLFP